MDVIEGTGAIVVEPDWSTLLDDGLEIEAAKEHWRIITTEMRDRQILSPANGPSVKNLVLAYILRDRHMRQVAENGSVTKPRRGNSKAIARISPFHTAAREWLDEAMKLEAALGISPRNRGSVSKVEKKQRQARAADAYLKSS